MSDGEPQLPLVLPEPATSAAEIEQLQEILRAGGDWMTAAEIAARIGDGGCERSVRRIASAACPAVVSFPGSRGYKLWQLCTVAEIDRCIAAFESQGADMFRRAVRYRQAYHRRFRGAPPTIAAS